MTLESALLQVREGRLDEAEAVGKQLAGFARTRLDAALAYRRGDVARARELAAHLWYAYEADPTMMSLLVQLDHPELREPAAELLMRIASDVAHDVTAAWQRLATHPADHDAWCDVISHLIANGRAVEAVHGVARALSERVADFSLWAQLATLLLGYRQRVGLLATIELGRLTFPDAPEMHATATMIFLGLGDLESARAELVSIDEHPSDHPLVVAARSAVENLEAGT